MQHAAIINQDAHAKSNFALLKVSGWTTNLVARDELLGIGETVVDERICRLWRKSNVEREHRTSPSK